MSSAIRFSASVFSILFLVSACTKIAHPPRILVFSKTAGYRHASIPAGIAMLRQLCRDNGMVMDTTEDAAAFTDANLKRYAAVVFLNTTGDVLNPVQETDFERYIQAGGGYVGIHSATDTEYGWSWYGGLAGAYFNGHPAIQEAHIQVCDHDHKSTQCLPDSVWIRTDEWYNFKNVNPNLNILLKLDESSYQGGTMNGNHPLAWYHEYDGGRAFYTAMGHTMESYDEPLFRQHILGGLLYAIGQNKRLCYDDCRTERTPDPTRFVKTVLASELNEPMEFDMLPDGKVLLIERRGAIKLFEPATGLTNTVYKLPVHDEHEDGLMGLALDPDYEKNRWIYLYYSPPVNKSVNYLSRFIFRGDTLDPASEKILLEVAVQREECCHAGGSIEFDGDGNLYLSTGDNTNPFASEGYAPIDERAGRSAWDAQKSSANTMDLRGKIIRIRPQDDGSYVCPAGNLFTEKDMHTSYEEAPQGLSVNGGRPEIYVMGCRNPFRISLDKRRKLLFWGEVGPDAGEPDSARGPQGYDEVNRARSAGFFGWPYFIGNNYAYRNYNFTWQVSGPHFDPERPLNDSPFNTGRKDLPPAQPAFIWYPYGNSPDFPLAGTGGRNAMAGPVYYCDEYPPETRFPAYYDGKLITYDWMRGWMMAVTLDSLGNFGRMERFGDSIALSRPMDMFIDRNGSLWVLEYGTQWFAKNADARLSRIDYVRGNRPPKPVLQADRLAGAAPCTVIFSAAGTRDYDGDRIDYKLDFGDGTPPLFVSHENIRTLRAGLGSKPPRLPLDSIAHVYRQPGKYEAVLTVTDTKGIPARATLNIEIGNEPPIVYWDFGKHNRSFYQPGDQLQYRVVVEDREDGSLSAGTIPANQITVSADYLETGFDITAIAQGHQTAKKATEYARGKRLIDGADCSSCHAVDRQINGPSYQAVAARYQNDDFAVRNLSQKVIKGGGGNWGQTVMSAHPQLREEDVGEMVRWILSLGTPVKAKQSLPLKGEYALTLPDPKNKTEKVWPGAFIFQASYADKGAGNAARQEGVQTLALRPAFMQAESADGFSQGITTYWPYKGDTAVLKDLKDGSYFLIRRADLSNIHTVALGVGSGDKRYRFSGGRIELRLDRPDGPQVGFVKLEPAKVFPEMQIQEVRLPVQIPAGYKPPAIQEGFFDLYFVLRNEAAPSEQIAAVDWIRFDFLR